MEIQYIKISDDSWDEIRDSALTTIHKNHTGTEITHERKKKIMRSEHSPIREMVIRIKVADIPRFVADQLVRHHIGVQPFMGSHREDRGSKPREELSQIEPTVLKLTLNAHAFINMSKDRLCYCASKETRELWEETVKQVTIMEPELGFYCVPSCVYRCGCKEFKSCGLWSKLVDYIMDKGRDECFVSIDERYTYYHKWKEN